MSGKPWKPEDYITHQALEPGKGGTWRAGTSGNPGGRPSYAKALEANKTTSPEVLAKLIGLALEWVADGNDARRAQYAHLWLTEYILRIAKPKESLDVNVAGPSPEQQALLAAIGMTPHERRLAIAESDAVED